MSQKLKSTAPWIILPAIVIALAILGLFPPSQHARAVENTEDLGSETENGKNPTPKKCCACFKPELQISYGDSTGTQNIADKDTAVECYSIPAGANGEVSLTVTVFKVENTTGCEAATPLVGIFEKGTGVKVSPPKDSEEDLKEGFVTQHQFSGEDGMEYEIRVSCKGDSHSEGSDYCPKACITLGCGCDDGACDTGVCPVSADPGHPSIEDSLGTSSNGDSSGPKIVYIADQIENLGVAGLRVWAPNDGSVITTRDTDGHISSVRSGNIHARVVKTPSTDDPEAFEIRKSTNLTSPESDIFRTTRYENLTKNGALVFNVASTFKTKTTSLYYKQPEVGTWHLVTGIDTEDSPDGLLLQTMVITDDDSTLVERRSSIDIPTGDTTSDVESTYTYFPWGTEKTKQVVDPGTAALTTTWDYYEPGELTGLNSGTRGYSRLQSYRRYDGYEETHLYDLNTHTIFRPFGNNDGKLIEIRKYQPQSDTVTITQSVNGILISKKSTLRESNTLSRTRTYTSDSEFLETVTERYPYGQDFGGQIKKITRPDGTVTIKEYSRDAGTKTTTTYSGIAGGANVSEGTKTERVVNRSGELVTSITWAIGSGEGTILDQQIVESYDLRRPTSIGYLSQDGGGFAYTTSRTYGCCGLVNETDRTGVTTYYAYDALRRQIKSNRLGVTHETQYQGLTNITFRYPETGPDAEVGNLQGVPGTEISRTTRTLQGTTTTLTPDADGDGVRETTIRTVQYNVKPQIIPLNLIPGTPEYNAYIIQNSAASISTTTYPDGSTSGNSTCLDGRTKASTNQAGHTTSYVYGVHSVDGSGVKTKVSASGGTQWTQTYTDLVGRIIQTEYPNNVTAKSTYYGATGGGDAGKLKTSKDPDNIITSFSYNAKGERTTTQPVADGGSLITTTAASIADNSNSEIGVAYQSQVTVNGTVTSTSYRSIDGLRQRSVTLAGVSSSVQALGNPGDWTVTSTTPDQQKTVQTYVAGRLQRSESFDNATTPQSIAFTTYDYDDLGRTISTTDSRTGDTTIDAFTATDAPSSVSTNNGNDTTSYGYDSMGRRTSVTLPDGSVTRTSYTPGGQVQATWGSQTYARYYSYDLQGRMITLRTKPDFIADPDAPTETIPTNTGGSVTSWEYDPARGWLVEKNYHGEITDANNAADYTYTAAGRLNSRTWERGAITNYYYDQGQLDKVTYSDDTPNVEYQYDTYGRPMIVTQTQTIVGEDDLGMPTLTHYPVVKHTYSYDANTMALDTEKVSYDTNGDGALDFNRILDRKQDDLLRPIGLEITGEYVASYGYDTSGRLNRVHQAADIPTDPAIADFIYTFEPNTYGLVKSVTGPAHTVTNTYEANRNVLTTKENSVPSVVSNFAYTVNSLGQRTDLSASGDAFAAAHTIGWKYNQRGELESVDDSADNNGDRNRAYKYDAIGNREESGTAFSYTPQNELTITNPIDYTADALNQYTKANGITLPINAYDDDGNLSIAPLPKEQNTNVRYHWDAENRLVKITNLTQTSTIVQYGYDYLGRRISKQVGTATATRYIYDGWNLITEYTGTTLTKSYTWGMDLSGSMQGAGGVGGLLAVKEVSNLLSYYPTYDGNGNVSEYLDAAGAVQAHYEYDAFGNTTVSTGSKAADFSHRFSTKPLDSETGLYYYGYRYYDPKTGRWPSRDPIGEDGGDNLFAFVGNDGVNRLDMLGLEGCHTKIYFGHGQSVLKKIADFNKENKGCGNRALGLGCAINGRKGDANGHGYTFPNCNSGFIGNESSYERSNGTPITNGGYNPPESDFSPDYRKKYRDKNNPSKDWYGQLTSIGFTRLAQAAWKSAIEMALEDCNHCCCDKVVVEFICNDTGTSGETRGGEDNWLKSTYKTAKNAEINRGNRYGLPNNAQGDLTVIQSNGNVAAFTSLPHCGDKVEIECKQSD